MKLLFVSIVLAASSFGQATVHYNFVQPACQVQTASRPGAPAGCYSAPQIHVTATSPNPSVIGFLITVEYWDGGRLFSTTLAALAKAPDGGFPASMLVEPGQSIFRVSAVELLAGSSAIAQ